MVRVTAATTNTGLVWLVLRVPLVLALGTEQRLRSVYRRYRGVRDHAGLAGAELARVSLDAHGLQRVAIRLAPGTLTDNYFGDRKTLSLSRAIRRGAVVVAPLARSESRSPRSRRG